MGGGGIFNNGDTLAVRGTTIDSNEATGTSGSGGGILLDGGAARLDDVTITNNTAVRAGGGIETANGAILGKAMTGLLSLIAGGSLGDGSSDAVVFIHTGGTPGLFAYRDAIDPR